MWRNSWPPSKPTWLKKVAWIAPVTEADRAAHQAFLAGMRLAPPDAWQHLLRVSQDCIGCGICQRVALRLHPAGGGPGRACSGRCQTCLACAHVRLPRKAVQLTCTGEEPQRPVPLTPCHPGNSSRPTSSPGCAGARGDGRRARMTMGGNASQKVWLVTDALRSGPEFCPCHCGPGGTSPWPPPGTRRRCAYSGPAPRAGDAPGPGRDAPGPDPTGGGPRHRHLGPVLTASSTTPVTAPGRRGGGTPEEVDRLFQTNFFGPVALIQAVLPHAESGQGPLSTSPPLRR